jgi:hypothetical protein
MRCWFFFSIALDRDSLALAELVKHFLAPALLAVVRIQDLEPTLGGVFEDGASLCRNDPGLSRVHALFHSGLTGTDTRFPHLGQFTAPPAAGPNSSQRSLKAFSNSCRIRIASAVFKSPPVVTNQSNFR